MIFLNYRYNLMLEDEHSKEYSINWIKGCIYKYLDGKGNFEKIKIFYNLMTGEGHLYFDNEWYICDIQLPQKDVEEIKNKILEHILRKEKNE